MSRLKTIGSSAVTRLAKSDVTQIAGQRMLIRRRQWDEGMFDPGGKDLLGVGAAGGVLAARRPHVFCWARLLLGAVVRGGRGGGVAERVIFADAVIEDRLVMAALGRHF